MRVEAFSSPGAAWSEFQPSARSEPGAGSAEVDAHFNLGVLLRQKGALAAAEKSLRKVLELEKKHAAAQTELGIVFGAQGSAGTAPRGA